MFHQPPALFVFLSKCIRARACFIALFIGVAEAQNETTEWLIGKLDQFKFAYTNQNRLRQRAVEFRKIECLL